jgi:hypothetical protein
MGSACCLQKFRLESDSGASVKTNTGFMGFSGTPAGSWQSVYATVPRASHLGSRPALIGKQVAAKSRSPERLPLREYHLALDEWCKRANAQGKWASFEIALNFSAVMKI